MHFNVERWARMIFTSTARYQRCSIGFVRRFVLAEADVAVDAENGILGLNGKVLVFGACAVDHFAYKGRKWLFHAGFVALFVGVKPLAVVVGAQVFEEGNEIVREVTHGNKIRGWNRG